MRVVKSQFLRPLLFVLSAICVLSACGGSTAAPAVDNSPADVKIMVGGLNKQIYIPNKLTELLGYFKEQNLNVTLIDEGSGQASEEEVIAGNVDGGSGSFSHVLELQPKGKFMTQVVQFQIAPGEAEMVDAKKADTIKTAADLKGKNLGVSSLGSGTHTITLALLGRAGLTGTDAKFVAVGAGDTFIAAIQQQRIDAGMTTEPTISRLFKSGVVKGLIDLRTPTTTRAALGPVYPSIRIIILYRYLNEHTNCVQLPVTTFRQPLKWL